MFGLNQASSNRKPEQWQVKLDQFVKRYETELSALAWGLSQEWQDRQDTLGIDLKPQPHFVVCSRKAIEQLNENVNGNLQEILGILDGHNPEKEVVIIAIGEGQVKLIHFEPQPLPAQCFQEGDQDLDRLIQELEQEMRNYFQT